MVGRYSHAGLCSVTARCVMNSDTIFALAYQALWLMVVTSLPPIGASLLVGFLMGLFQAATQIQESTLSVVPKLAAAVITLVVTAPWIAAELAQFGSRVLFAMAEVRL
jgi:flagellar biosynthesis protein FliQ